MTRSRIRWLVVAIVLLAIVVVPFLLWGAALDGWVAAFVRGEPPTWMLAVVLGGLMAVDVLLPVPSSVVGVVAGMSLGFGLGAVIVLTGLTLGTAIGYGLGATVGRAGLQRYVGAREVARLDAFGARYGDAMVLVLRSVPVLAEASVITAGAARVPVARFAVWATVGNAVLSLVYAAIGAWAIEAEHHGIAVFGACVVPFVGLLFARRLPTGARARSSVPASTRSPDRGTDETSSVESASGQPMSGPAQNVGTPHCPPVQPPEMHS